MLPNLAAINKKTGLQELQGLHTPQTRMDTEAQRNSKPVTPNSEANAGLQNSPESVTPNLEKKMGLQKTGYAQTRMDTGSAPSVTPVTRVTPKFTESAEQSGNKPNPDPATPAASASIATDWVAMIAELDELIDQYCRRYFLSKDAHARILAVRYRQSQTSIPDTLQWFRDELADQDGEPERGWS